MRSQTWILKSSAQFLIGLCGVFLMRYISCLYILDVNLLSIASFANIFSQSIGCLVISLTVSFAMQKLISLIRNHLFIFAFVSFVLGDRSKKYCYDLSQRMFCLCSLLEVLWYHVLYLGILTIWVYFCVWWGCILISFFYM